MHTTRRFELAWKDRFAGPPQTDRRFLDYVVDGQSLHARHGMDRTSCLGCFLPAEDERAARRLLGEDPPDLDDRVAIFVCPECGDLGCGAITTRITRTGGHVIWSDLANSFYDHLAERWEHDTAPFASWPPLRFDATEYDAAIRGRPRPDEPRI